jgi:transglutaminase-like putative cysteine protease
MHLQEYLEATEIVDFLDPAVGTLASELASNQQSPSEVAARCFQWVRDEIRHSGDHSDLLITISASDVLSARTGLCYAKSHLLAALLRANGIPCGFVYQRLALDDSGARFCLHGLNAVWLPDIGWYRIDARGDRAGIKTSFDPPREHFAFAMRLSGECILPAVFERPLPVVVETLKRYDSLVELSEYWPDVG